MCTHWGPGYLSPPESGLRLGQGPSRTGGLLLRPWSLHLMEVGGGEEGGQVILGPLIPPPSPSAPCCSEQRPAMSTWSTQRAELRPGGNSRLRSILPSPVSKRGWTWDGERTRTHPSQTRAHPKPSLRPFAPPQGSPAASPRWGVGRGEGLTPEETYGQMV